MENFKLKGILHEKQEPLTGTSQRGAWTKQDFVLKTNDQYPTLVAFQAWNDTCDMLHDTAPGNEVEVTFSPESRKYNDKYFTNLKATYIANLSPKSAPDYQEIPPEQAAPQAQAAFPEAVEDLPF